MEDFYVVNGRFYITVGEEEIEVSESIYKGCKKINDSTRYMDRKYNKCNTYFDEDSLIAHKFKYIGDTRAFNILEEEFIYKYELHEMLSKLNNMDKKIIKMSLDGYSEREISEKLNITQQSVNKHKQRIRKKSKHL